MNGLDLEVDDKDVRNSLGVLIDTLDNPIEIMDAIGNEGAELTRLNFNDGTDPYGYGWEHPVFRSGQPLRDTGRLMNSITHHATGEEVAIGTDVIYAAVHQTGMTIKAKNAPYLVFKAGNRWVKTKQVTIPARPFLPDDRGLPQSWRDAINGIVADAIYEAAR